MAIAALPPDRTITGSERIAHLNNSPDTLPHLNFKLFVNIHKPGAPLPPHDSVQLSITWRYEISRQAGREGCSIPQRTIWPASIRASPSMTTTTDGMTWSSPTHNWFPFYMGINETRYDVRVPLGIADLGKPKADEAYKPFRVSRWINDASPVEDLPMITPEDVLSNAAWGNNAYGKASRGNLAATHRLGDVLFKKSLQAFMERWHGKHPIP